MGRNASAEEPDVKAYGSKSAGEPELVRCYCDLHVHIGRTSEGQPVKISGSRDLTFAGIAKEAAERKGIGLIGIIDSHSPAVQRDILNCLHDGEMTEAEGGGIAYRGTAIILGTEIEIREPGRKECHVLAFMPDLKTMTEFSLWMGRHMRNVNLSSQRIYVPSRELQDEIYGRGGILIPAHIFTPHKGLYGCAAERMAELFDLRRIAAVELGLSADSEMAGYISELDPYTFLTNSDAHSLGKIGREYNEMELAAPSFAELRLALEGREGRRVTANYGLNPRLGKYHRTYCAGCGSIIDEAYATSQRCPYCGSVKLVQGVLDRILNIADRKEPVVPARRPPYRYQVPLEFIPGLGKAKMNLLLQAFGTEMNILHEAGEEELAAVAGAELAAKIAAARSGSLELTAGGGGTYGRVALTPKDKS
ncbi:TIGR00375 family protein [Paenibacillus sophorae]|uniref:Endonuclease Q family protein n=1 Tax=Paenibacillus sophorae TaxID=1333845 RepID=A0A1H8N9I0_9BACL|nr:endonuclease Q family protein [Paenibacillus sophorae]QWU14721.1 endonuclease Q family protein [Paenibacillus sophorae]SEO26254.1 TIGR00375 family protein [Paenibacillus sophorae]